MRWRLVCNSNAAWRHIWILYSYMSISSDSKLCNNFTRYKPSVIWNKRRVPCQCAWQVEGVELSQRVQVPTSDSCADDKEKERINKEWRKSGSKALGVICININILCNTYYIHSWSVYPLWPPTYIALKMYFFFRTNSCHSPCDEETQLWL